MRDWLVKAVINPQNPEREAVTRLAQVFSRFSFDAWWHDFVRGVAYQDPSGARALSAAFIANVKGHYADAVRHSFQAAKIFREQQNVAGELRARYELAYAQRRLLQMKNCQTRADLLQAQLAVTQYSWLQAQVAMELAICLNFISQPAESEAALSHSMQIASTSNLPICILRTIGFAQGLHSKQHHFEKALREGTAGLQQTGRSPSTERIYQFYAGFSVAAQELDLPGAAEVLMRHAVDILRTEDDKIQLGAALEQLSKLLAAQKDNLWRRGRSRRSKPAL